MARKAREKSKTGVYAVSLRGTAEIFRKQSIKDIFIKTCEKYLGDGLRAIRFSRDKVEMLIMESDNGISLDMKPLITSFARAYNRETGNTGKVFADRFKSIPMDDDETINDVEAYLKGEKNSSDVFKAKRMRVEKSCDTEKGTRREKSAISAKSDKTENDLETHNEIKTEVPEIVKTDEKTDEEKHRARRNSSLPTWLL